MLQNFAIGHEEDAVAHLAGKAHLVGHDDHGHTFLCQLLHDVQDLADHLRVQGGGRLVEEHELGLHGQGANDGDALLLAAGELVGVGVGLLHQVHALQQLHGQLVGLLLLHPARLNGG